MTNVRINRPWLSSFNFRNAVYKDTTMEQVHKLSRNFVCSLDLGCPGVRHVNVAQLKAQRELYKQWVADWKVVYREVSGMIRQLKTFRRTVRFPALSESQRQLYETCNRGSNVSPQNGLRSLSYLHLERLQETAQVLLNARYNAKLAAAEARRRLLASAQVEEKLAA